MKFVFELMTPMSVRDVRLVNESKFASLVKEFSIEPENSWRPTWFNTSSAPPASGSIQGKKLLNELPRVLESARPGPSKLRGSGNSSGTTVAVPELTASVRKLNE